MTDTEIETENILLRSKLAKARNKIRKLKLELSHLYMHDVLAEIDGLKALLAAKD